MREKYEELARLLNELGVYTSEDGDALFIDDDCSSYWVEETFNNEGPPKATWVVKGGSKS